MSQLHTAILEAKRNMSAPTKNKKANYGRYADLEAILQSVEPPLADQGLVITQRGDVLDGKPVLVTVLTHTETGEEISSTIPLLAKNPNDPQQLGSAITYARRYGITALLSVVADDDDDGNTSAGREKDGAAKKPPKAKKPEVAQEKIEEVFKGGDGLSEKMIDALEKEYVRAEFDKGDIVPEVKALLDRDFGQLSELTEAEARTAAGHARKILRGEAERLA